MAGTGKRPWPSRPQKLDEPDHPAGASTDLWVALGKTAQGEAGSDQARAAPLVARLDRIVSRLRSRAAGSGRRPSQRANVISPDHEEAGHERGTARRTRAMRRSSGTG